MSEARYGSGRGSVPRSGRPPATEREAADLFLADLLGERTRPRTVLAPPPALVLPASWSRPDLIFDHNVHRPPDEAEALMGELADEGWRVIARPGSDIPPEQLRPNDAVVQRAIAEGRLAFVKHLGTDIDARALYGRGGLIREDTIVLRQQIAPEIREDDASTQSDSGETIVHIPMLTAHAADGFVYTLTGPNCVLRWAQVPRDFSGALDVVVHFHGFKEHNRMRLQDKANASGLDLATPGVTRPTLGLVPQGHAFVSNIKDTDGFNFPAIASRDALSRFIDSCLSAFKTFIGSDRSITVDRVVLTGHSGGGAALNLLMASIGQRGGANAFEYFDATYGGGPVMTHKNGWLIDALRRDAAALQNVSDDAERTRFMRARGGSLRILFIDGTYTAPTARTVDAFIVARLRELVSDDGLRRFLRRYYRAERVAHPKTVYHSVVPKVFGGRLLADAAYTFDDDAVAIEPPRGPAEDVPTATDAASSLDRVRSAIDGTLQAFRNIVVSVPAPTARDLAVQTPYFINKPTSPSYLRAEEKRPALMRNPALAKVYNALRVSTRVGKGSAGDIRAFLQSAIDTGAVPGQSSGVSAEGLKGFLSDMGVGVDCSGFVCQALNACVSALGGRDTIDVNETSSAYLRGGSGHNTKQFDLVARPSDLSPGDTMWKTGHIRVVHRVEPQSDGSIQFVTAESSSVSLVGPVAKTWKCPQSDRFSGILIEHSGRFTASTEVNVFSRYKPLGALLRGATSGAAEDVPTTGLTLTQTEIDRLAAIEFGSAADVDTFFSRKGAAGFIGWFNDTLGGRDPFRRANGGAIRVSTSAVIKQRFATFWDSIPAAYDRPRITALDFAGLTCIVLNETEGNFGANPEQCGKGRRDARGNHPGLAYAFDRIAGVKYSYNTLSGNRRAGDLFNDADFIRAHGGLAGATRLANHGNDFNNAWNSEYYPQNDFSTAEDLGENGFIMQADFYKFRGRGVIQTTSREGYLPAVSYIQRYTGTNNVLNDFKKRWAGITRDVAATTSTNADWDLIFAQGDMLARAVYLHSGSATANYRTMSSQASVLLDVPAPLENGTPRGVPGSIFFMGRVISGRYPYAAGVYRDRVLTMLRAMLAL